MQRTHSVSAEFHMLSIVLLEMLDRHASDIDDAVATLDETSSAATVTHTCDDLDGPVSSHGE